MADEPERGVVLAAENHPLLFALIADVADGLETPLPTRVEAVASTDIGVRVEQRWVADDDHVLQLGLSAMAALDVHLFSCVLAHELGHLRAGSVPTMEVVSAAREVLDDVRSGAAGGFLKRTLGKTAARWLEKGAAYNRDQEVQADAAAVALYGAEAVATAQRRMAVVQRREAHFFATELGPALDKTALAPDMIAMGFAAYLAHHRASDDALETLLLDEPAAADARYPSLRSRIDATSASASPDVPRVIIGPPDAPALSLLSDSDELDAQTTAQLIAALDSSPREVASWPELFEARLRSEEEGARELFEKVRSHFELGEDAAPEAVTDRLLRELSDADAFHVLKDVFGFDAEAVAAVQAREGVDLEAEARVTLRDLVIMLLLCEGAAAGATRSRDFGGIWVGSTSLAAVAGAALSSLDPWTPLAAFRRTHAKKD